MNSSDSAEELIKIYLDGVGFTLRIAGEGSKNLITFLVALSKDNKVSKGKTRLTNMLNTGKELKIFTIRSENLKKFSQEAKKYGVLYCVLADKKNEKIDGLVDIMVRQEDASKVDRIAERFNFTDIATIKHEIEKEKEDRAKAIEEKSEDEKMIDELLAEPEELEQTEVVQEYSPSNEQTEEKSQLKNSLNTNNKLENDKLYNNGKKSVKKELEEITKEVKKENQITTEQTVATGNVVVKEKQEPKHLKQETEKSKGKHFKEPKHLQTQNNRKKRRKRNKIRERSK